jgi:hypothetical protein
MPEDSDQEIGRLTQRPAGQPPSGLLAWTIEPIGNHDEYATRLRSSVLSGLIVAADADFNAEAIEPVGVPTWFLAVTEGHLEVDQVPLACELGRQSYYRRRSDNSWTIQEWLYCFDPDLRHWEWWDVTSDQERVTLWTDSKGESIFASEELLWAVFASGASDVTNLGVLHGEEWSQQNSLGL